MKQKITINDIAAQCNVSKSSVSRYLNKGYVSKENAEKIRKAIEETGFKTNYFASRLKAKYSHIIGIMVSNITSKANAKAMEGMQKKLNEVGYQGMILLSEHDIEKEKEAIQRFVQQGVDGIIIVDSVHQVELQESIERSGIVVLYANHASDYAPFLALEERMAGYKVGSYLLDHKYQRLLYVESEKDIGKKRKEGIAKIYKERDQTYELKTLSCEQNPKSGYALAKAIVKENHEVVLCESDDLAVYIMKYFQENHIHVPQNISMISFGGDAICEMISPSITSVSFDYHNFGANLVVEVIAIIEATVPKWESCEVSLIERESTNARIEE